MRSLDFVKGSHGAAVGNRFPGGRPRSTLGPRAGLAAWRSLIVDGGRDGLALAVACAAIGVVIAGVTATGLDVKLNQTIAGLGGTSLLAALLLAALCSLVIGMGLPTAAAYLTVVFIAGPAIISLGVDVLQAHLFVFNYAVLSAITPPVALALFAACAIAKAPLAASAASVLRISFVGFLLPVAWISPDAMDPKRESAGRPPRRQRRRHENESGAQSLNKHKKRVSTPAPPSGFATRETVLCHMLGDGAASPARTGDPQIHNLSP